MAKFTYNGKKYDTPVESQDASKVAAYKQKILQPFIERAQKQGRSTISAGLIEAAERKAIIQERQERYQRAAEAADNKTANKAATPKKSSANPDVNDNSAKTTPMVVTHDGVKYNVDVAPRNTDRVKELYQQKLKERIAEEEDNGGSANDIDAEDKRQMMADARAEEEDERKKAALAKVLKSNPKLNMGNGDEDDDTVVGISQRRKKAPTLLAGATPAQQKEVEELKKKVMSDAEVEAMLPTLGDTLNKIATNRSNQEPGIVHKSLAPSGKGDFFQQIVDMAYRSSGAGGFDEQISNVFRNHDRFDHSLVPPNDEYSGYTFITRPRLCLADLNLAADRRFVPMMASHKTDVAFYLRCMMDTQFCKDNRSEAQQCPFIDLANPFAVLWCNAIRSVSGFNDPYVATETTSPGYFQEEQTYAIGGDEMNKTTDITINFRDYPGGPVAASFDYFRKYLTNLGLGTFVQYANDIDANRLGYTMSIYRFITDRTRRHITKMAKATGCFPVNSPVGVAFNKNEGETRITSLDSFSITFKANKIDYVDPIIMHEFNMLVRRYVGASKSTNIRAYGWQAQDNFAGIPYIRAGVHGPDLCWIRTDYTDSVVAGQGMLRGVGKI